MKPTKKIALIHDICSIGKNAMTHMIPVLSTMGFEVCPIPTVILSSHPRDFLPPLKEVISPDFVRQCGRRFQKEGIEFEAIFIGYLGTPEMITSALDFIRHFPKAKVFLDPILGDKGLYYSGFDAEYKDALKILLSKADYCLPNLTEICFLLDKPYEETPNQEEILSLLLGIKTEKSTIILSGLKNKVAVFTPINEYTCEFIPLVFEEGHFHGTGDIFDAVFMGSILHGKDIEKSVHVAHNFIRDCIKESIKHKYNMREGLVLETELHRLGGK